MAKEKTKGGKKKGGCLKKVLIAFVVLGIVGAIAGVDSDSAPSRASGGSVDGSVDKTLLVSVAETAAGNDESAYTADSWAVLTSAIEAANVMIDDTDASQEEVDAARMAVTDAVSALEKVLVASDYASVPYDDAARTPDAYQGESLVFSGKVVQVIEDSTMTSLRVATDGGWDDVVLVQYENDLLDFRVLEDDYVTAYGVYTGLYTYESAIGASITVPSLFAEHVVLS